jgi:hypothetical protein
MIQRSPNVKRWELLYEMGENRSRSRRLTPEPTRNELDEECTFSPSISGSSQTRSKSPNRHVNMLYEWESAKNERVRQVRESELYKDLEDCTFKPEIHDNA